MHLSTPEIVRQLSARDPIDPTDCSAITLTTEVLAMHKRLGKRLPDEFNRDLGLQSPPGTVTEQLLSMAGEEP